MTSLRTKGKSTVVWLLMGMVLLGLGGFGITNFSGTSTAAIGAVGDTEITAEPSGGGSSSRPAVTDPFKATVAS